MSKIPRTTCPLCNLGCELGFEIKAGEVRKVAYITDSRNQGRLCPKGNAAAAIVNHPKRLYNPLVAKKSTSLAQAIGHLNLRLSAFKPDEILVVYDASFTCEELATLTEWAQKKGYKNLAYAELGPETAFLYGETTALDIEKVTEAQYAFIVGDAYSQASVISGYLVQAKESSKDFRYIVADSFATNTTNFAHRFVKVRPGYEGLLLYGLVRKAEGKNDELKSIAQVLGVDESLFDSLLEMMRNKQGVLIYAPSLARSFDPFLAHGAAFKLASLLDGMTYLRLGNRGPAGITKSFFSYVPLIMSGKIKAMLSFAARFPWNFTQLRPVMRKLEFVAAGNLFIPEGRFEFDLVLPVASEFAKKGRIRNLFGEAEIDALTGISGTLPAGEFLARLGASPKGDLKLPAFYPPLDDKALADRARGLLGNDKPKKGMKHLLVGSETAVGYLSVFENEDWVKISPDEALSMGVKDGDIVGVETEQENTELKIKVASEIPSGLAVVSTNCKKVTGLFELVADTATGEALLRPTWSRIWKK